MNEDLKPFMNKKKAMRKFIAWMFVLFIFVVSMLTVVWLISNVAYNLTLSF